MFFYVIAAFAYYVLRKILKKIYFKRLQTIIKASSWNGLKSRESNQTALITHLKVAKEKTRFSPLAVITS